MCHVSDGTTLHTTWQSLLLAATRPAAMARSGDWPELREAAGELAERPRVDFVDHGGFIF